MTIKSRRKTKAAVLAAVLIGTLSASAASAETAEDYAGVTAGYAEEAPKYTFDVPYKDGTVSLVEGSFYADVHTACYVRSQPGMDTPDIGVIETGTGVRVWGVTDNGWAAVYTSSDGGKTPLFGYIKKSLLFDQTEPSVDTEPASETAGQETDAAQPAETSAPEAEQPQALPQTEQPPSETGAVQPEQPVSEAQTQPQTETAGADLEGAFEHIFG